MLDEHTIDLTLDNIMDQWNPLTGSISIHSWLPLMSNRLEPLYQHQLLFLHLKILLKRKFID
jgi:hypothetical protein